VSAWPSAYVGLPFVDGGRNRAGVDCWGLVRLVLAEQAGVDVPTYGEISAHDLARVTGTIRAAIAGDQTWRQVEHPGVFDVAVMRGNPLHVGIMIDTRRVLHVESTTAAVQIPVTHPSVRHRLIGFYRHRDLLP
jgi:cell wall-associated NlpC family hydrolase